jgi:formate hydrogenlyase subunit 6/NADH:ubiquinone oxidoreductase subunit I/flavodoxin
MNSSIVLVECPIVKTIDSDSLTKHGAFRTNYISVKYKNPTGYVMVVLGKANIAMSAEIYYFSGTGNSFFVAKEIAGKIGGKLVAIPSVIEEEQIKIEASAVGFVFPVFYATNDSGVPLMIRRFIQKLENLSSKYIFAVCTCGSMPGTTIENLAKLIKSQGGELVAGFTVKMNNETLSQEKQDKALAHQKDKLDAVSKYVLSRKTGRLETRGIVRKIALAPLLYLTIKPAFTRRYRKLSGSPGASFRELIPIADRSFQVNEKCSGCGTCAQVCPADNIKLVDGRPVWHHHCETCLACYSWCPQAAIGGEIVSYNARYHHPAVKLQDMLRAKQ